MLTVRINEIDYSIKQRMNEFTIGEFEIIANIINDANLDKIDKYSQIFVALGIPQEVIDDMNTSDFFELIKLFALIEETDYTLSEKAKSIEIKGRTYESYSGDEFVMNVKQMKLIEKHVKTNPINYISYVMAIIFKDTELTNNEHYVDAHIKHKASLFRENVTVNLALPFIGFFSAELLANIQTYTKL